MRKLILSLLLACFVGVATAQAAWWEEADGSDDCFDPWKVIVSNGSLTCNADNSGTLSFQAQDDELDTIAALTETNGVVMFVAGGEWTADTTPAIDCTDCTNIPAGTPEGTAILSTGEGGASKFLREDGDGTSSWQTATAGHADTITWTGTSILETGAAHQLGDGTDATVTYTWANTGTNVAMAFSSAAIDIAAASFAAGSFDASEGNITNVGQIDADTIIGDGATLVLGDNSETIQINSSDWDISTTGAMTGIGAITSDGVVTSTGFTIGAAAILEAELEIIDGATLTTTELNYVDGVTSAIQTQIDTKLFNNASDTMTGTLTADGLTLGANENITLGAQTLDHDGTDFVMNDTLSINTGTDSTIEFNDSTGADPCGTGTGAYDTGAVFWSSANYLCYCDGTATSVDLKVVDDTACAY